MNRTERRDVHVLGTVPSVEQVQFIVVVRAAWGRPVRKSGNRQAEAHSTESDTDLYCPVDSTPAA
jgi:hypothetical protein